MRKLQRAHHNLSNISMLYASNHAHGRNVPAGRHIVLQAHQWLMGWLLMRKQRMSVECVRLIQMQV